MAGFLVHHIHMQWPSAWASCLSYPHAMAVCVEIVGADCIRPFNKWADAISPYIPSDTAMLTVQNAPL